MGALIISVVLATCAVFAQAQYEFKWTDDDAQRLRDSYERYFKKDSYQQPSRYTDGEYFHNSNYNPLLDNLGRKPPQEFGPKEDFPNESKGTFDLSQQALTKPTDVMNFVNQEKFKEEDTKTTNESVKIEKQREDDDEKVTEKLTVNKTVEVEKNIEKEVDEDVELDKKKDYLLVNNNSAYLLHEPDTVPPKTNQPNVVYVPNNQPQTSYTPNQQVLNIGYTPNQGVRNVLMYINGQLYQVPAVIQQNQNVGQNVPMQAGGNVIYTVPNKQYYIQVPNNPQNQGIVPNTQYYLVPNNLQNFGVNPGVNAQYINQPNVQARPLSQNQIPVQYLLQPNPGSGYQYPIVLNPNTAQYQAPNVQNPVQYQVPNVQNPVQYQVPNIQNPVQYQVPNIQYQVPNIQNPVQYQVPNIQNPVQYQVPNSQNPVQYQVPNLQNPIQSNLPSNPEQNLVRSQENPVSNDNNFILQPAVSLQNFPNANLAPALSVQVPNNVLPAINARNDARTNNQPKGDGNMVQDAKINEPANHFDHGLVGSTKESQNDENIAKKEEDVATDKPKTNADVEQTKEIVEN